MSLEIDYGGGVNDPTSGRIRLIVLFGGQSAEHDVSRVTAAHVLSSLNRERYDVEAIGISRDGAFLDASGSYALLESVTDGSDRSAIEPLEVAGDGVELVSLVDESPVGQQTVVLPLLHGPMGEDGTIQGMCEMANVAYVGAGVLGSAVAMDKAMAKTVIEASGIPQTHWMAVSEHELAQDPQPVLEMAVEELGLPIFVKPANMGSSVGVSRVDDAGDLATAIDKALAYDEVVILEEGVVAREIELAVLGNREIDVSVPGEIVPAADFYDYADKYEDGAAQLIIPADLPEEVAGQLQQLAVEAYQALRVEGMARADFLYEEDGRGPLLNELNTIPGFTPISMYPKLWEASGLAYPDLIDRLVDLALERHGRRSAKRTTAR